MSLSAAVAASAALSACGGARQDAKEPSGTFPITVLNASFPTSQALAQKATMTIQVRNDGTRDIPDLAVTVSSFSRVSAQPGLADPSRPVWVVDSGPRGGETAYTNTWALGSLGHGKVRTFVWQVTPVVSGPHTVNYRLAAGLNGKARAELARGGIPQGSFRVNISGDPPQARVDPQTGRVIRAPPFGHRRGPARSTSGGGAGGGYGTEGQSAQQPGSGTGSQP
jgi:hypothetical protein